MQVKDSMEKPSDEVAEQGKHLKVETPTFG
jgi:hypothetical protein